MKYERVLLDIEVQHDFFDPSGSCYTPEARKARANVKRLFQWARRNQIPVMSTVLRVRKGEIGPLAQARQSFADPVLGRFERRHVLRHVPHRAIRLRGVRRSALGNEGTPPDMAGNEAAPLRLDIGAADSAHAQ